MPTKTEHDTPPAGAKSGGGKKVLYRSSGGRDVELIAENVQADGRADLYDPEAVDADGKPVLRVGPGCPMSDEPREGYYLNPNPPPPKKKEEEEKK